MTISQKFHGFTEQNIVIKIAFGVLLGIVLGATLQVYPIESITIFAELLGKLFVGALKAIAPIIVFILICESIATNEFSINSSNALKKIIILYIIGTLAASICAVAANYIYPITLVLQNTPNISVETTNLPRLLVDLVLKMVDNPINALANGNFIALMFWAVIVGITCRKASQPTKDVITDFSTAIIKAVNFVIYLAPLGICGLVTTSIVQTGFDAINSYLKLVAVLVICMLFVAFVVNAVIVFVVTKKNPYPLIFACIRESAVTAFFTRSSAANIPVNIALAKKLGANESLYSMSIPLGATINMAGAAITITVLTLAAANTLNIQLSFLMAIFLCFIASISACGASGIAGGSLMLIPVACSLFGISNDVALQVVAIGFIIGVVQDSFETALNSSTDVIFTAAVSSTLENKS